MGPVIAGIFLVELERMPLPKLIDYMIPWKDMSMINCSSFNYTPSTAVFNLSKSSGYIIKFDF